MLKIIVKETNLARSLAYKAADYSVDLLMGSAHEHLLQDLIGMQDNEGGLNFWNGIY